MDAWLERYATALAAQRGDDRPGLDAGVVNALLALARDVAHGTERKNAPLATYLAGWHAAQRTTSGLAVSDAVQEATAVAETLMEEAERLDEGPDRR